VDPTITSNPVIIIPCYNRKEVTLACLHRLRCLDLFSRFGVLLVDDASSDGTAQAVAGEFPEVEILHGTGDLYWTGAMEMGMKLAFSQGASSTIWLNDDTVVATGAIETVTKRAEEIGGIVSGQGQIVDQSNGATSYFPLYYRGKTDLRTVDVDLSQEEIAVDSCRGNLVAISYKVAEAIGLPDGSKIPHVAGDSDYGLRASKAGFPVRVLTKAIVRETCIAPIADQSWLISNQTSANLLKSIFRKNHGFYPPMVFTYHYRHWGILGLSCAVIRYLKLIVILCLRILPRNIRIFLFSRI
jgi:GT2 family glycosyltransferase